MTRPLISLIAGVASNGVIGKDNALLWRLPEDLQHFRRTTLTHPVIMGRKTWDSLPARFRPLPGRTNIVVTRNTQWHAEGAQAAPSLQAALTLARDVAKDVAKEKEAAKDTTEVFVIGGAELYALALPLADRLVLTEIDRDYDGDAHFPAFDRSQFREVSRQTHHSGEPNHFDFAFVTYQRKH